MSSAQRTATILVAAVMAIYMGRLLYISVTSIMKVNDFEVFHHIGEVAATGDSAIYNVMSPVKQRGPFLYPPSAAVLFIPLSWLSHDASGVVFSIVKIVAIMILLVGSTWLSGCPPRDALGLGLVVGFVAAILFRPINSDFGNGQINILTALMGVGGVWLVMAGRAGWWIVGATLIAAAAAIKLTPALLLAAPMLHRKWKAMGLSLFLAAVFMLALPAAWFGTSNLGQMLRQHSRITSDFTMNWPAVGRQVTVNELLQFGRAQSRIDRLHPDLLASNGDASPVRGFNPGEFLTSDDRAAATVAWVAVGILGGAAFLLIRMVRRARSGVHSVSWPWDLAMLCGFTILLSPRVHKAHLVILIPPIAWLTARVVRWTGRDGVGLHKFLVAAYAILVALFIAAESWAVSLPGWELPAHPGLLLGVTLMLALVAILPDSLEKQPADAIVPK